MLQAQNISLTRDNNIILNNVSLTVGKKDFVTIIGPNGAGKSMLLSCLMGLTSIDSGKIIRSPSLKIGYVPQSFHIDVSMPINVMRFLKLGCASKGITKKELAPILQKVIEETQITSLLDRPLYILSGGERQRVLVARALIHSPNLLVLDEPAQNLDVSSQLSFYNLIDDLYQNKNISILMVSHELHLVMASTQRVICLYKHVCCSGAPQVVMKDPEFVSLFGKDMSNMMAVYQHQHNHQHH